MNIGTAEIAEAECIMSDAWAATEPAKPRLFWTFSQNNSGGRFYTSLKDGIAAGGIIVEAESEDDAIARAESLGLYWNGADDDGPDCPCCGSRWSTPWDEGYPVPTVYGKALALFPYSEETEMSLHMWGTYVVHYMDGTRMVGNTDNEL